MREIVREILRKTFEKCREEGLLQTSEIPDFVVEIPKNKDHGDIAANLAMLLPKTEKKSPRDIAQILVSNIVDEENMVEKVEIAGPGFINFNIMKNVWHSVLSDIEEAGENYGSSDIGKGEKIMVEFVSANPTGPLHIGHGRGAVVGDVISNILEHAGYDVEREYYINDIGNQMQNLGKAVYIRYQKLLKKDVEFPDDLYKGDYIIDIAKEVILKHGNKFLEVSEDEAVNFFSPFAADTILKSIENDLEAFGVKFDTWFSEKQLFDCGKVQSAIEHFKSTGLVYENEGALWFKTTDFGDEKDRVVVRDDGRTTYFASDIAYHKDKYERGFKNVIDVWGADHHGYIPRIRAVLEASGISNNDFNVILIQMVNLLRDGQPVAMSTRSGEFVTLKEVIDEVGMDSARFSFLTRRSDASLDFDLEVAKKQNDENPVYYVQYGHARISSIISFGEEKGHPLPEYADINEGLLIAPEELDIIKKLSQFTNVVAGSAKNYEPHRVAVYLMELVAQFHSYYNKHRVITEDEDLSSARLFLMSCVMRVLKNGLDLVGVDAPLKM
jgi:arginyl-tRNA synthetase